jgi:hypothetical protein
MRARIFAVWLISFILGGLVAPLFESAPGTYFYLGLIMLVGALLVYAKRYIFGILFGFGLLLLSISLFQFREASLVRQNEQLADKKITIVGYISDVPVTNEFGQSTALTVYSINGSRADVKLKIYADQYPALYFGETIKFNSKVKAYADKKWQLAKDGYAGEANVTDFELTTTKSDLRILVKDRKSVV